jgi:putative ABC transport system permease protein
VGVAGVLVLTSVARAARAEVLRNIESLGRNVLVVNAAKMQSRAGGQVAGEGWTRRLLPDDAAAIVTGSNAVLRAAPAQEISLVARFGPLGNPTTVLGTTQRRSGRSYGNTLLLQVASSRTPKTWTAPALQ